MKTQGSFEDQWPPIAARLTKRMARSCPDPTEREDLVQEVGLRLFRMWDRVDDRPLWPLVLTIALNLRRDACRAWHEPAMPLTHDVPATFDVERESLARVELRRVQEALQLLSATHRDVLLAEIGKLPPVGMTPAAVKMTRMRARRRLSELLDGSSGIFVFVTYRVKDRLVSWRNATVHRVHSAGQQVDLAPFAAGMMAAAMTLVVPAAAGVADPKDRSTHAAHLPDGRWGVSRDTDRLDIRSLVGSRATRTHSDRVASSLGSPEASPASSYSVDLPGGDAELAAEGSLAGSRLALGSVAPALCIGAPGSGSCGTSNGGPLVKVRVGVSYGAYRVEREIAVDPGANS